MLNLGLGLGLAGRAGGASFNINSLAWEGAWTPDYAGSPWTGIATGGSSSGRELTVGTAPGTGSTVNGYTPASFDGSTHYLVEATNLCSVYMAAGAYTIVALANVQGLVAAAGAVYDNEQILAAGPSAPFGLAVSSSGFKPWHQTSAGTVWTAPVSWTAFSSGAWTMFAAWYDGATLSGSVNDGTPATVAATNVVDLGTTAFRFGRNYAGAVYTQMDVLELRVASTDLSTHLADIKASWNSKYGLSL